jgi:ABC-type transport system involved in multi-copper enzyme maturation permease subunit
MVCSFLLSQTADPAKGVLGIVGWVLLGLIVLAFLIFGLRDLGRLSWTRISAISSVSFDESIRRRVLWVTPLAILGAVVVSELQNAVDPQDSIRQTTKICLFATGLVVTLVAIILASTNLQKEIETRVIYTIVTKPTTRLEIVLGKVWGFAKVSATILLIMGLFTYAYLHVRARVLQSSISSTLAQLDKSDVRYASLKYYHDAGLLNAKAMTAPASLQMLARPPVEGQPRWIAGGQGQRFTARFDFSKDIYPAVEEALKSGGTVELHVHMPVKVRPPNSLEMEVIRMTNIPMRDDAPTTAPATTTSSTIAPTTAHSPTAYAVPMLMLLFKNPAGDYVLQPTEVNKSQMIEVPTDPKASAVLRLMPENLDKLFNAGTVDVIVEGRSPGVEYAVEGNPTSIEIIRGNGTVAASIKPTPQTQHPLIVGTAGRFGQQLIGGLEGYGGVAIYDFPALSSEAASAPADELFTFEVKAGIERGGEQSGEIETLPEVAMRIRDPKTGAVSDPFMFRPETNRMSYLGVPRSALPKDGGPFQLLIRVMTPDQWLGINPQSVVLATASRSFAFNLFKSLLILWLLSVLVVSIAVFCSTFVSWPIAVVLTLLILLGRWGFEQIGDSSGQGIGSILTSQTQDAAQARFTRTTVDALSKVLAIISTFLPDIGGFQPTADIERGISVPISRLGSAGWVLLGYGVPMVLLAYLILKRKEVAP